MMSPAPTTEKVIVKLAQERATALICRDVDTLNFLLSPDFVYTNADGTVFKKRDYIQVYVLDPSVRWRSQTLTNVRVHVSGNAAVLIAKVHDEAMFGDHALDADFRTTQVYVQREGHWQYCAGHTSNLISESGIIRRRHRA
jgi:ketosteroid isomerase-like protein